MRVVGGVLTAGWLGISAVTCRTEAQTDSVPPSVVPARSMLTMGGIRTTPERRASPLFSGKELPRPPQQDAAWSSPDADLPANYVSATQLLFEQGLADPRGCEIGASTAGMPRSTAAWPESVFPTQAR